ncbi:MAG TPA: thiamine pyrophosphate-dependent enzyme [Steroidobacteraceae bacterium]|nr:thiamine pyrophosphate-dependent enzyme [Steroidobacteraceae bacterium]
MISNSMVPPLREETPRTLTGGEAVVDELLRQGIGTVFALPGVQNDALFNAFYDRRQQLRVIHTRHEQGAGYLALGAALATGRPAVCNIVPGPGVLNAGAAMATAYALNAPVLFVCGQIPLAQIGRRTGALHEIPDQLAILRQLTRFAARIEHPADVPAVLGTAMRALTAGRPGPAAVEIPMDVLAQAAPVSTPAPQSDEPPGPRGTALDEEKLGKLAQALVDAQRPLLFVGSGAQDASDDVRTLAALLEAPVVSYRTGRGVMDSRSYLSFVLPAARPLWRSSDVVLALGTTLRIPLQSWERVAGQKILRIDIDPASHALIRKPDLALHGRLEDALPRLIELVREHKPTRPSRRDELMAVRAEWEQRVSVLEPQISYLRVIRQCLGEHGVLVDELTQVGFASRLVYPVYRPRTFLCTGYMGTLGWGFPTALGAKVAKPDHPVVSISGDGGFMFAASELATAVQHRIPLVTVLFNNNQYGNVQQMQRSLYGGRVIASDLVNPDFVRFADSFGARGVRVSTPQELTPALDTALAADGPTVIEVPVGDMPSADQFR